MQTRTQAGRLPELQETTEKAPRRGKQRATEDFVTRLLDVRDNLERALEQDEDTDIRGGVESTLDQFDQQLDRENVEPIEPEVGQETDPRRHEVLATIASDQPEDTVAQIHRSGYVMGEKVLRPAQVAVSDGSLSDQEETE
ncbi:nucleotide exchange factor GrpE [Halovenus salina]|uniref:nucleotide exchange factor GrpE n=1 Tax=Halovenus salina TaxID=1510225 RepID=UPI003A9446B7